MSDDFTPPTAASLDSLLAFIANPKDAGKQIAELKKEVEAIEKSRAALAKESDALKAAEYKADAAHLARTEEITKRENELRRLDGYAAKLDVRERAVTSEESALSGRISRHVEQEKSLKELEIQLHYQETQLRNSRAAVDKRTAALTAGESDLRERMARLRALAS